MENKESLMLERAYMFLEEKKWVQANEYCDKILDENPYKYEAHLIKLLADCKVVNKEELVNSKISFESNINYRRVLQYGYVALREELKRYSQIKKNKIDACKKQNKKRAKSILSLILASALVLSGIICSFLLVYNMVIIPQQQEARLALMRSKWLRVQGRDLCVPYDTRDIIELGEDNEIRITDYGKNLSVNEFLGWFDTYNGIYLSENYWTTDVRYSKNGRIFESVNLDLRFEEISGNLRWHLIDHEGKVPLYVGKGLFKLTQEFGYTTDLAMTFNDKATFIYNKDKSDSFSFTVIYKKGEK